MSSWRTARPRTARKTTTTTRGTRGETPSSAAQTTGSAPSPEVDTRAAERKAAAEDGSLRLMDMIDGVLLSSAEKLSEARDAHFVTRSELRRACETIRAALAALGRVQRVAVTKALTTYLPSSDAHAEADLLQKLKLIIPAATKAADSPSSSSASSHRLLGHRLAPTLRTGRNQATERSAASAPTASALAASGLASDSEADGIEIAPEMSVPTDAHPMRGALLMHVLQSEIWSTKRTFAGRTKRRSNYELSMGVERVDYFISHAWPDDGARKLAMLREFLCLQVRSVRW